MKVLDAKTKFKRSVAQKNSDIEHIEAAQSVGPVEIEIAESVAPPTVILSDKPTVIETVDFAVQSDPPPQLPNPEIQELKEMQLSI